MIRVKTGRSAGTISVLTIFLLWVIVMLPTRIAVPFGFVLALMTTGVILSALAAWLDSKWWLLAVLAALTTSVIFFLAWGA